MPTSKSASSPCGMSLEFCSRNEHDGGGAFGEKQSAGNPKDVAAMTGQLSTLVGAGIPIVEALTALIDQVEKPKEGVSEHEVVVEEPERTVRRVCLQPERHPC